MKQAALRKIPVKISLQTHASLPLVVLNSKSFSTTMLQMLSFSKSFRVDGTANAERKERSKNISQKLHHFKRVPMDLLVASMPLKKAKKVREKSTSCIANS